MSGHPRLPWWPLSLLPLCTQREPTTDGPQTDHRRSPGFWGSSVTCVSVLPSFICLPTQETQKTRVRSLGQEDPLEKKMATAPVFLPGGSHGQRSLAGYSPRGHKESDRTEHACMWYSIVWIDCISFFFLFFWLCGTTCGISVPRPGIEPHPLQGSVES